MKRILILSSLILLLLGSKAFALSYNTLYAHDWVETDTRLYTVDASTGTATPVGLIGYNRVSDIAFYRGTLYGAALIDGATLIEIDPDDGVGTVIGNIGFNVAGLAVSPSGILYGASNFSLYSIDYLTGIGTFVFDLPSGYFGGDIAFDPDGTLYWATNNLSGDSFLFTISTGTGDIGLIGSIGFNNVLGLSFKDTRLYATTFGGQLLGLNTSTGEGTLVGTSLVQYGGLSTSPVAPVPEPATMLLLGSGLVGLAGVGKRFKKSCR